MKKLCSILFALIILSFIFPTFVTAGCVYPNGLPIDNCPLGPFCSNAINAGSYPTTWINKTTTDAVVAVCEGDTLEDGAFAAHFGVEAGGYDEYDVSHYVPWTQDAQCHCVLYVGNPYEHIAGGAITVTWKGKCKLWKKGTYTLTASFKNLTSACEGQTEDTNIPSRTFTVQVVDGVMEDPHEPQYHAPDEGRDLAAYFDNGLTAGEKVCYESIGEYDAYYGYLKVGPTLQSDCSLGVSATVATVVTVGKTTTDELTANFSPQGMGLALKNSLGLSLQTSNSWTMTGGPCIKAHAYSQIAFYQAFCEVKGSGTVFEVDCTSHLRQGVFDTPEFDTTLYQDTFTYRCWHYYDSALLPAPWIKLGGKP